MPTAKPRIAPPTTIDDYIAIQPVPAKVALTQVRDTLRKALPRAEEVIAYNMPGYRIDGSTLLSFAAWKKHYSLYGSTQPVLAELAHELTPYKIQKGTISFPYSEPVPTRLITTIAKLRVKHAISSNR